MKFEIGQTVKLIKNCGMSAAIGATAIVLGNHDEFIVIRWKTHSNNQTSGSFYLTRFEPVIQKNRQLLFAFMEELRD